MPEVEGFVGVRAAELNHDPLAVGRLLPKSGLAGYVEQKVTPVTGLNAEVTKAFDDVKISYEVFCSRR